ncbi:MAG: AMP-binding protein [Nocardioidaceae bacterium]
MLTDILGRTRSAGVAAKVLTEAGVVRPYGPLTLASISRALLRWGTGPAGGFATLAIRAPRQVGLVDELGPLTYGELHRRSNALAHALADHGVGEGDRVALMVRNHRGFVDATVAVAKLGADVLYLNTAFAGPQLVEVLDRERPRAVIHDEEFTDLLAGADVEHRLLSWSDSAEDPDVLGALSSSYPTTDLEPPEHHSRIVILTSGTTGTPKGASRNEAGVDAAVAMLDKIPLRHGWRTHIAAPLFHTWGFAHLALAMLLCSTVVLRRTFDPVDCLRVVEDEQCESLVVVPVMLQRILALPDDVLDLHDVSCLRVVAASGSALPGRLATTWMDRFGDNLYNVYGSTEVAYGAIATPADLAIAPASAGTPPLGTVVRILDDEGEELPQGQPGRIFVGNPMLFEGYTGGGSKPVVDGLMATGDVGRFGLDGRLYIEGREDEMIVSGGENVFPREVEDCLAHHPGVHEAAAVGVDDDVYGQRLRAYVVRDDEAVTEDELRAWVRDNLARYKVPRDIVFVDALPRNATGKVVKMDLSDRG